MIPMPLPIRNIDNIVVKDSELVVDGEFNEVDDEKFFQQQARNRQLGHLAQEVALKSERRRLAEAGHPNPNVAKPVWKEWKRGYDILSCEVNGVARHIEVKSARKSGKQLSFFLSTYERRMSQKLPNYYFYLVTKAGGSNPQVLTVKASQLKEKHLRPASLCAAFSADI